MKVKSYGKDNKNAVLVLESKLPSISWKLKDFVLFDNKKKDFVFLHIETLHLYIAVCIFYSYVHMYYTTHIIAYINIEKDNGSGSET